MRSPYAGTRGLLTTHARWSKLPKSSERSATAPPRAHACHGHSPHDTRIRAPPRRARLALSRRLALPACRRRDVQVGRCQRSRRLLGPAAARQREDRNRAGRAAAVESQRGEGNARRRRPTSRSASSTPRTNAKKAETQRAEIVKRNEQCTRAQTHISSSPPSRSAWCATTRRARSSTSTTRRAARSARRSRSRRTAEADRLVRRGAATEVPGVGRLEARGRRPLVDHPG